MKRKLIHLKIILLLFKFNYIFYLFIKIIFKTFLIFMI